MSGQMFVYSFTTHLLMINGREMENFGEGDDAVSIEPIEDGVNYAVGADGNMQASISANEAVEIKVKFLHGAPENDYLEELYEKFRKGLLPNGFSFAFINTMNGKSEFASRAFIPKKAATSRGTTAQDREWTVIATKISTQKANF